MALHNQETRGGGGDRDYHRLRICVKLHIEQSQRSKNFWIQNEVMERGTVIKGEKGQISHWTEDRRMFSVENRLGLVRKEGLVVFYMNR